jgi:hypothetical protein
MFGHFCTWEMCMHAHQNGIHPLRWQLASNQ